MTVGNKGFLTGTFITIFLFILVLGLANEVSLNASLSRAFMAATAFTAIMILVIFVNGKYVFFEDMPGVEVGASEMVGGNLDFTVNEPLGNPAQTGLSDIVNDSAPTDGVIPVPDSPQTFVPLNARQIDPELNRIISSDPNKVAEIVRKMGFED